MPYTQQDADRLRAAIAKGVTQLRMGDEQIVYRSLDEMRSILAEMETAISGRAGRQHYPSFARRPE
jgi:hypothetical protein